MLFDDPPLHGLPVALCRRAQRLKVKEEAREEVGVRRRCVSVPICRLPAKNLSPPNLDGVYVRCPKCGDYEISGTALSGFLLLDQSARPDALEKAKGFAKLGDIPSITTVCL